MSKIIKIWSIFSIAFFLLVGCTNDEEIDEDKISVVATTTMLTDLLKEIGEEKVREMFI